MVVGDVKSKIDKIWETFWTGGVTLALIEWKTIMVLGG